MRVFISYRREDVPGFAGRLYDHLAAHLDAEQVFMDIDTIKPGQDFVDAIEIAIIQCDALLAIIGPRWLTITAPGSDRRRLDDPLDFVRLEIAKALERNLIVIPVLIDGTPMPAPDALPEPLRKLARLNAHPVSHERFRPDVQRLIAALENAARQAQMSLPEHIDLSGWWIDHVHQAEIGFKQRGDRVVGFYTLSGVKTGVFVGAVSGHVFEFYWRWLNAEVSGHGRVIIASNRRRLTGHLWEGHTETDLTDLNFVWHDEALPSWLSETDFTPFAPHLDGR
jgi:hypothetical protein